MSPVIQGGRFYAIGQSAWAEMSASGLNVYTGGVDIPKIQLINEGDLIYLILGAGLGNATYPNAGKFTLCKYEYGANIVYHSRTNLGNFCGFQFNDDGTISTLGSLIYS